MKAWRWVGLTGSLVVGALLGWIEAAWAGVTVRVELANSRAPLTVGVSVPAQLTNSRGEILA
ncbi:MAG: stage II sporulation protein SpoIID, partial [Cyanobacteriota bacterium]